MDGLPSFVNNQWRESSGSSVKPSARGSSTTLPNVAPDLDSDLYIQQLQYLSETCPNLRSSALCSGVPNDNLFCGAYIADSNQLCRRVNTLQSLLEVNREMANMENTGVSTARGVFSGSAVPRGCPRFALPAPAPVATLGRTCSAACLQDNKGVQSAPSHAAAGEAHVLWCNELDACASP